MQALKSSELFEKSLKNFEWLNEVGLKGTDFDYVYEKNGRYLILEGKFIHDGIFYINFGQHTAIKRVTEKNGYAFYVGINKDSFNEVYIVNLNRIGSHFGLTGYKQIIKINDCRKMSKNEFAEFLKIITTEFLEFRGKTFHE